MVWAFLDLLGIAADIATLDAKKTSRSTFIFAASFYALFAMLFVVGGLLQLFQNSDRATLAVGLFLIAAGIAILGRIAYGIHCLMRAKRERT